MCKLNLILRILCYHNSDCAQQQRNIVDINPTNLLDNTIHNRFWYRLL